MSLTKSNAAIVDKQLGDRINTLQSGNQKPREGEVAALKNLRNAIQNAQGFLPDEVARSFPTSPAQQTQPTQPE